MVRSDVPWACGRGAAAMALTSILLVAPGCREQAPVERAPTIAIDSAGVEVVTSDPLNSDTYCTLSEEPVFSVGTLEGADPYMFYFLRGVARLSDGSIAVMDNGSGEIRVFGADGRHLRSMGGKGEGPGEFRIGRYIWAMSGDTLWVGDYRPWRYHVYASTGEFSRTVAMDPIYLNGSLGGGVLANGVSVNVRDLFQFPVENFRVPEPLFVEAHAADGTVIGELAKLDGRRWGAWDGTAESLWTLFDPVPVAFARGTTIAITTAMEPEVRLLDEELRLRRIVRWLDPDREVTGAHVRAYREALIERRGGRDSENWQRFDDDMISESRPVADVFPTVSSLRVGRDGRLWVYPYPRPGEGADWWIFGQDGDFQCRLEHPGGVTIYELGADYLLGVHIDELDVERVVMHELRLP
ncbi:MAG: hypothetical protein F4X15_16755 [Gemmatimonadetes bacterium]|nr:hypothetical protein [Gemmatimonadota bacterium]MYC93112.1 hypothetical protein [Gemmatimonadota bacterium]